MATGDKLVNLDDLKVAYDKQQEDTNALKSAIKYNAVYSAGLFIKDKYINKDTGAEESYSGWSATDYIPVSEGQALYVNFSDGSPYNYYYDSNKDPLEQLSIAGGGVWKTVPSGAAFVRISATTERMNNAIIKFLEITDKTLSLSGRFADAKITGDKNSELGKNIIINSVYSAGIFHRNKYINDNGAEESYQNWSATDYIPVSEGQKIYIKTPRASNYNKFYDSDKNVITETVSLGAGENWLTAPSGSSFVRISNTTEAMDGSIIRLLPETDKTLNIAGFGADAKAVQTAINNSEKLVHGIVTNSYVDKDDHGKIKPYQNWSRTDFIDCSRFDVLYIKCPNGVNSKAYNCFYSQANDEQESFVSSFLVGSDETVVITVPSTAKYFILSNSSALLPQFEIAGYMQTEINKIAERMDTLELQTVNSIFADEVKNTTDAINQYSDSPSFVASIVTDTHALNNDRRMNDARRTFQNVKAVSERAFSEGLILLGDMILPNNNITQQIADEILSEVISYARLANPNIYAVNGNHDGELGWEPQTENYATMMRMNEDYVIRENGAPYYYKDYSRHKLRTIFLATNQRINGANVWGIDNTQLEWFTNTLAGVPDGYDVCIFAHIAPFDTNDFRTNRTETITALNSWIANNNHTGKCIGWYSGHEHLDLVIPKESNELDCPQVILQCSLFDKWEPTPEYSYIYDLPWVANNRVRGTASEDCWTTFIYNKADNKVYLIRFGAGNDLQVDLSDYDNS